MTLASNSENFYFSPNSVLNFRKSYQIWEKLAQEQKSYRQKTNWGVFQPPLPVLIGLTPIYETLPPEVLQNSSDPPQPHNKSGRISFCIQR